MSDSPLSPHLQREDLLTAERCFGATGSVAKSRYLHKVNNMVRAVEAESPGVSGIDHFSVQSKLAVLSGELHRAEQLLLQQAGSPPPPPGSPLPRPARCVASSSRDSDHTD